jgi:tight adherence protein B
MMARPARLDRIGLRGRFGRAATAALVAVAGAGVLPPVAMAADTVPATLSDVRTTAGAVNSTLVLRSDQALTVDPNSVKVTVGGQPAGVKVSPAAQQPRSTMLVIDTSGSMGASGMGSVRAAVRDFLAAVPPDVKVGVVSFASTSGVDVAPTTDRKKVLREVSSLVSKGETSLYAGIQDAVDALGTKGERSIVLLSDGGDTMAEIKGGPAGAASEKQKALDALAKAKVRAEVVAFKSPESNSGVLTQFAKVGGGSVANAGDRAAVQQAFTAAARTLESQAVLDIKRPPGVGGTQDVVVTGTAGGAPFEARSAVNLGDTAPVAAPTTTAPTLEAAPAIKDTSPFSALSPMVLYPSIAILVLGVFFLVMAFMGNAFKSSKKERLTSIEAYGFGRTAAPARQSANNPTAISAQLVNMGDKVMSNRDSTTHTMALMDRADLPWRAGEWFVLRILAVVIAAIGGYVLFGSHQIFGVIFGIIFGFIIPPVILRYLAKRRAKKFEAALPDVLMLVATSLASGFSLLQALDSVAKDAPEPASKEFSRALAEARIGSDVSDALDHMGARMDSQNMRWTTMAIRIQREVGGNLAETLRTTAATLREREMLKRQVKTLSAEGKLSAYILIALPIGVLAFSTMTNYEYVSLLWTTLMGIVMSIAGLISMAIGVWWMSKVVKIEV